MRRIKQILLLLIVVSLSSFISIKEKPTVLLIMLHQSTKKNENLEKENKMTAAKLLRQEDEFYNNAIIQDFKSNFKFCSVLFFYSTDYDAVKEKRWNDVNFLDSEKKIDLLGVQNYLIADINYPPSYQSNKTTISGDEPYYAGGFANSNDPTGIILYDSNFELLTTKLVYTNATAKRISLKSKQIKFTGSQFLSMKLSKKYN